MFDKEENEYQKIKEKDFGDLTSLRHLQLYIHGCRFICVMRR